MNTHSIDIHLRDRDSRCGMVALVGRANVGKSTLMNRLVGKKVSITSTKPQTTRSRILGISTDLVQCVQAVYVDTPGLNHKALRSLNRCMNQAVSQALDEVDLILWVVDGYRWRLDDEKVLESLKTSHKPVILAVNKIDKYSDHTFIMQRIDKLKTAISLDAYFLLSAKKGLNIEALSNALTSKLPRRPFFYPESAKTNRSLKTMLADIIREKIFRLTGQELPYATAVMIEEIREIPTGYYISGLIFVEKLGQKKIVIGSQGKQLKMIGQVARIDIEHHLGCPVFLNLWVKVKEGWPDKEAILLELGYANDSSGL